MKNAVSPARTSPWVCTSCGEMARGARPPRTCGMCGRAERGFEQQRDLALPSD